MTTEIKPVNYTPEQTLEVVSKYQSGMPVEMIAQSMGKTTGGDISLSVGHAKQADGGNINRSAGSSAGYIHFMWRNAGHDIRRE